MVSQLARSQPEDLLLQSHPQTLLTLRHTCAHVLAMAVQRLFPETKVTIGPWTDNGFYYDFDRPAPFTPDDLKKIEKLIELVTTPPQDSWWDLCSGPHLNFTGEINPNAFALESIAGAYWRGDENKPQLQRIYGTAWETAEQLQAYLQQKEEAKRRDHRKLGQELDLFSIQEDAGGGLVFWHPRGAKMRYIIEEYWRKSHLDGGYELLYTPHVANLDLWKTSGHFDFYRENMFDSMEIEVSPESGAHFTRQ
jgi:threonyl-tRNA synthetase